jgi:hypothetical protein
VNVGYTVIDCKVVIINTLPKDLAVHSGYESPFRWAGITVQANNGRILAHGQSVLHGTPFWPNPGKAFDIPRGRSTNEIRFTVEKTYLETNDIQFYVQGILVEALVNSTFSYSLTSNVVSVRLKPYPKE